MRQRAVRTQPRTSDEVRPTARRVPRDKSHQRRAAIPHRRAAEATRPVHTAAAGTATLAGIADTAHLRMADRLMADLTAADAAIQRLRRIAPDRLAAITVAADRLGVPVITVARAADTRARTEATDVKRDLILTNAALQFRAAFLFAESILVLFSAYRDSLGVLCILPDSA